VEQHQSDKNPLAAIGFLRSHSFEIEAVSSEWLLGSQTIPTLASNSIELKHKRDRA
jgi:hypothetical protein